LAPVTPATAVATLTSHLISTRHRIIWTLSRATVVYLLDCCSAAAATSESYHPILAASGIHNLALDDKSKNFTLSLTEIFKQQKISGASINLGQIHSRLVRLKMTNELPKCPAHSEPRAWERPSPVFCPLPNAEVFGSPLCQINTSGATADIVLRIKSDSAQTATDLANYLESTAPANITDISLSILRIDAFRPGSPGRLILTVDVGLWSCMPSNPDVVFLGYGPALTTLK